MVAQRASSSFLLVLAFLLAGEPSPAHEIPIHVAVTDRAIDLLIAKEPQLSCVGSDLREFLISGTEREDDWFEPWYRPVGRFFFHFFRRLSGDTLCGTAEAACHSSDWASNFQCTATFTPRFSNPVCSPAYRTTTRVNEHSYNVAAAAPDAQQMALHLGHLLHLLQDLASPAHARNDPHVHIPGARWNIDDRDPFEFENANRAGDVYALPLPSGELPRFGTNILGYQAALRDLQAFTESKFYSNDTIFCGQETSSAGCPGPKEGGRDRNYVYDLQDVTRRIAAFGPFRTLRIDSRVAREQFDELIPVVVRYTAGVMKDFLDAIDFSCPASRLLFSNFGPGGSYNTEVFTPIDGSDVCYPDGSCSAGGALAVGFVPVNTSTVTDATLALALGGGTNSVVVYLLDDSGGLPNTIIDQVTLYGVMRPHFDPDGNVVIVNFDNPLVSAGSSYWLAVAPGASDTRVHWFLNSIGDTSPKYAVTRGDDEASWSWSVCQDCEGVVRPVFAVRGIPASP